MTGVDWEVWEREFTHPDDKDEDVRIVIAFSSIVGALVWGSIILWWRFPVVRDALKITWSLIGFIIITSIFYIALSEYLRAKHPNVLDQLRRDGLL